jgi:hypothetical protein
MVAITTRAGKGSPLTNAEMDANLNNLNESQTVMGEPMGHADKTQSTISFDAGTRTFTIAPVSTSFVVWCKGEKYTYTIAQTVVIPDTDGLHYIYFSPSGVLSTKMSFFTWDEEAPTSYVYWNATLNQAIYFADERHGVTLDWQTHEYLHRTRGAAIANGFAISGYTTSGTGSSNTDAQVTIEGGTFFDEDMQVDVVSTNTPTANTWQQDLSSPAQIPVLYLDGTVWKITTPNNYPVKKGTLIQYNLLSGGSWSVVDIGSGDFTVSWILATNNLNYPVLAVMNQSATNTIGQAEELHFEDLTLPGFPSVEFRPLYRLIFQGANSYSNAVKAKLVGVQDLRSISAAGVTPALISDHGNLSGLTDDDHPQYLSDTDPRPGVAQSVKDSLIPSTPVAGGIAYGTATSLNFTIAGAAGQILTSGGASVPTWTNAASANTASALVQRDSSGNFSAGIITAALSGNATTATTATHLAGGGANRIAYQTGSGASAFAVAPTVTDTFLKWDGSAFAWSSAGSNITDDTTTNATHYPLFSASNSGALSAVETSSTKLTYNPSTGTFSATTFSGALNGNASTASSAAALTSATWQRITGNAITYGSYGSIGVSGTTNGYAGISFADVTGTLMMSTAATGFYYSNSTWRVYWDGSGNQINTGNVTAYSSDGRLKKNVLPIPNALWKVNQIAGVTYDWDLEECNKWNFFPPENDVGVIAQDVQAVEPHAIKFAPFDRDPLDQGKSKSGKDYLTVQYEKLVPLLIEAVKELTQKVTVLEEQLKERT